LLVRPLGRAPATQVVLVSRSVRAPIPRRRLQTRWRSPRPRLRPSAVVGLRGAMDRLDRILALVRRHRPNLRLVDKHDGPAWRALRRVAPGLYGFTTVIGDTVYLTAPPDEIERDDLAATLAHELVHQLDQAEHGLGFYASYGVWPLPFGRTARAHWERRA